MPVSSRRLYRAGEFFQPHFRCHCCRCSAAQRSNDRSLFLRRLWRRVPRNTSFRRHARSIRRDIGARRLDIELRHLWARLFGRRCRHDFPLPRRLAAVTLRLRRKLPGRRCQSVQRASRAEPAQEKQPGQRNQGEMAEGSAAPRIEAPQPNADCANRNVGCAAFSQPQRKTKRKRSYEVMARALKRLERKDA